MSRDLSAITSALILPGQPEPLFRAVDRFLKEQVDHIYMTILVVEGSEVARVYSSDPKNYPSGGRKLMGPTPWGKHVLDQQRDYLARDREGIRWAFFDATLMESLGVGSAINIPIVYDGVCIGTLNLNAAEYHYSDAHLETARSIVPFLIPGLLAFRKPNEANSQFLIHAPQTS